MLACSGLGRRGLPLQPVWRAGAGLKQRNQAVRQEQLRRQLPPVRQGGALANERRLRTNGAGLLNQSLKLLTYAGQR